MWSFTLTSKYNLTASKPVCKLTVSKPECTFKLSVNKPERKLITRKME